MLVHADRHVGVSESRTHPVHRPENEEGIVKTTEKYPTYVNVDQVEDDQYLVNILLNRNQLEDLQAIANHYRGRRSGQYHAMVVSIDTTIQAFLEQNS